MKEKGPNVAIRAGLKTAGFPQLRTSLCVQQPSGLSRCGQYLFVHKLIYSPPTTVGHRLRKIRTFC